jgi:predicted RNA-binding Zn-ribbon protein involved in translation (DUF1610 family)
MAHSHACPNCTSDMELGFVPDHYAQIIQSHWHPGTASAKTITGNLKLDKNLMIPITTFRCPQCGLLVQFATK